MMSRADSRFRKVLASVFANVLLTLVCAAPTLGTAAPGNLDELLEQTRSARVSEQKANDEREKKFLAERNKQSVLVTEARAALATERQRSAALQSSFDTNEKKLTELQAQLEQKAGNLGEMFGVVRQVANDFSSVVHNSIISAQYPDREEFVAKLASAKSLPSMQDLSSSGSKCSGR